MASEQVESVTLPNKVLWRCPECGGWLVGDRLHEEYGGAYCYCKTNKGDPTRCERHEYVPASQLEEHRAWASVGRSGACVHSKTVEGCAGCRVRNAEAVVRAVEAYNAAWGVYHGGGNTQSLLAARDRLVEAHRAYRSKHPTEGEAP